MFDEVLIVGIAGGTASGKSTLAERVHEALGDQAVLIGHDRYYLDVPDPLSFNYDEPDALETALLVEHVRALKRGAAAHLPVYDFRSHRRSSATQTLEPRPVVLVEGILVLEDPELRSLMDLRVYVDAPDDLRLLRRIRRDVRDRGRDLEEVLSRWLSTVRPMHLQHVAPSREHAQLVVEGVGLLEPLVERVLAAITRARATLERRRSEADDGLTGRFLLD